MVIQLNYFMFYVKVQASASLHQILHFEKACLGACNLAVFSFVSNDPVAYTLSFRLGGVVSERGKGV